MILLLTHLLVHIINIHKQTGKRHYSTDKSSKSQSSASENDSASLNNEDGTSGSKMQQLKRIFAIYGSFGVAFHIVISLMSLGIIYLIVSRYAD